MTYRIYTERRENLLKITSQFFGEFTLFETKGYWKGVAEDSAVIEILASPGDRYRVLTLAAKIKRENKQESVLVTSASEGERIFV